MINHLNVSEVENNRIRKTFLDKNDFYVINEKEVIVPRAVEKMSKSK